MAIRTPVALSAANRGTTAAMFLMMEVSVTSTMSDRASKPDILECNPNVLIHLVCLQLSSRDVYRDVQRVAEIIPP